MSLDDRNAELEKKLQQNPIDEAVAALVRADKRRKSQILLLFISITFDLVLSVFLAFGWQSNHRLAVQADTNKAAIIRNCETANESRKNNREIWNFVLDLTANTPRDAEASQTRDRFVAKLDETFAPRDCNSLK